MKKITILLTTMLFSIALITSCSKDAAATVDTTKFAGNYAGTYAGGDAGTWTCTIDTKGAITASGVTSSADPFSGVGTCDANGKINFGATDIEATFNGQINVSTFAITGTWNNTSSQISGTFVGTKK
jgi:hypothetical protein